MTTRQFQIISYIIIIFCISITLLLFILFDFFEFEMAVNWTLKYFALPIFIVMIPICYFSYSKFIKQRERKYKSKILIQLQTIFKVFGLTLGISVIFTGAILSMIILTNAYIGESRTIHLNAEIVDYDTSKRRGRTRHYIKIQDKQLDRIIELQVKRPYQVRQRFNKTMKIGKWGLLYSKK